MYVWNDMCMRIDIWLWKVEIERERWVWSEIMSLRICYPKLFLDEEFKSFVDSRLGLKGSIWLFRILSIIIHLGVESTTFSHMILRGSNFLLNISQNIFWFITDFYPSCHSSFNSSYFINIFSDYIFHISSLELSYFESDYHHFCVWIVLILWLRLVELGTSPSPSNCCYITNWFKFELVDVP
jgi:hypothetical protein